MSWNLLASPYVRPARESEEDCIARARLQVACAADHTPDVIGLQEFWFDSPPFNELWENILRRTA